LKRLFFALCPSERTRKQINLLNQSIKVEGLKKVKADNLHVTLLFLGSTPAEAEKRVRLAVENIRIQPFSLYFDQLIFWEKPKILCLTTEQYDPQLAILVDALKKLVEQCGISIEDRTYKPHITLARKARELINTEVQPIEWRAGSFCLLESCSSAYGIDYRVLQCWDFKHENVDNLFFEGMKSNASNSL